MCFACECERDRGQRPGPRSRRRRVIGAAAPLADRPGPAAESCGGGSHAGGRDTCRGTGDADGRWRPVGVADRLRRAGRRRASALRVSAGRARPQPRRRSATSRQRAPTSPTTDGKATQLEMDIQAPKTPGRKPLVIFITGGGFVLAPNSANLNQRTYVADHGYVVASITYRTVLNGATWRDTLADVKSAIRYLRANAKTYDIDPDHVAAWGQSAGGYLASFAGTTNGDKQFDVGENLNHSATSKRSSTSSGPPISPRSPPTTTRQPGKPTTCPGTHSPSSSSAPAQSYRSRTIPPRSEPPTPSPTSAPKRRRLSNYKAAATSCSPPAKHSSYTQPSEPSTSLAPVMS
jgi:hypothetical protein